MDERRSAMPRRSLTDDEVHERVVKWWQIGRQVEEWSSDLTSSPTLLIGVTGPLERRWIWGSLRIDRRAWSRAEREHGGLYEVPITTRSSVDTEQLRGRLVQQGELGPVVKATGRQFEAITTRFFDVASTEVRC